MPVSFEKPCPENQQAKKDNSTYPAHPVYRPPRRGHGLQFFAPLSGHNSLRDYHAGCGGLGDHALPFYLGDPPCSPATRVVKSLRITLETGPISNRWMLFQASSKAMRDSLRGVR